MNHRGLDTRVWSPREWSWIEPYTNGIVRQFARRGRVEVRVDVSPETEEGGTCEFIDRERFRRAAKELEAAAVAAGLERAPSIGDVLMLETSTRLESFAPPPDDLTPFEEGITAALADLGAARAEEGRKLLDALRAFLTELADRVEAVEELAPAMAEEYQARLETRVREALERFEIGDIDQRAVVQEVAIFADRVDVSEELQRSRSHIARLGEILDAESREPRGKTIDFYLQELMREANTTGSKTSSVEIIEHVIHMKSIIEKMREQAANIE